MKKNWKLHQELEEKKEIEKLNNQLEKRIRLQTTLYSIVGSLSGINRPEDLYSYLVEKAIESCDAKKACFMIYDQDDSKLLALAQKGLTVDPGIKAVLKNGSDGKRIIPLKSSYRTKLNHQRRFVSIIHARRGECIRLYSEDPQQAQIAVQKVTKRR